MNTAVVSCLSACLIFAAAGPYLARALPPHLAVRLLVPSVVLAAGCGVFVLGTVAFTWLGQLGDIAEYGTWSPHRLHLLDPVPTQFAIAAGALLTLAAGWAAARTVGTARMWYSMHRACRHLDDGTDSPLLVVDSTEPQAFTTPGPWRPRIVVTTIAHVALLGTHSPAPTGTASASGGRVPARVRALLRPPPRIRARPLAALIALTLTIALGAVAVERTGESLFEHAERPTTAARSRR